VSREHWFGDQVVLEALIRFSDEELKHQELFRRLELLAAACMPDGYEVAADANAVAQAVLSKSTWAVMALTYHVEIFTQVHYKKSIEPVADISALWKDVFLHHWQEECQHAVIDELEWRREDAKLGSAERDKAVDELIELVGAVDGILAAQAEADARYFARAVGRKLDSEEMAAVHAKLVEAYRWQYIVSGIRDGQFLKVLMELIDERQAARINTALGPLLAAA
jgi:hypothetical protein